METGTSVGRLSTGPIEESMESVCAVADCGHAELLAAVAVFALSALFVLAAGAVLARLADAREAVETERARTRAERDAFERFRRRVVRLDATEPAPIEPRPAGGDVLAGDGGIPPDGGGLAAAREAYRETVMATPHYEDEYDESLAENVAAEFSGAVAHRLADDGATLTPALRETLAAGAERARADRESMLADLEAEAAALSDAESTLEPAVEAAGDVSERELAYDEYDELVGEHERLEWHESRVESLLADRQSAVHDQEADRPHWFEYLYGELSTPYPVLSAGTETLSRLAEARESVVSAASGR